MRYTLGLSASLEDLCQLAAERGLHVHLYIDEPRWRGNPATVARRIHLLTVTHPASPDVPLAHARILHGDVEPAAARVLVQLRTREPS